MWSDKTRIDWITLSRIGRSRFIKSFSIWFVAIPLIAKLFADLESIVSIDLLGHTWKLHTELPFSWVIFYICSLFFTVSNIAFAIWCPEIIKNYGNYREFREQDDSLYLLKKSTTKLSELKSAGIFLNHYIIENLINLVASNSEAIRVHEYKGWLAHLELIEVPDNKKPDFFSFVREHAKEENKVGRMVCAGGFLFGVLLLMFLAAQNIWFVMKYVFI